MAKFLNPVMRQLSEQQVRFAPRDVRVKQVNRAEELLAELDASKDYPYWMLCERVTSFRSEKYPDLILNGTDAIHDLRCFIEDVSASADLDADAAGEPVLTVADVSRRYKVSTKTVDRWRDRGLVSRRFRFGSRKRIGFLQSSVERFVRENADVVERGQNFSQLDDSEREEIIRRARRLARVGGNASEISQRLSRRFGRSAETIRYTLRNHDREHPGAAVFPDSVGPLDNDQKKEIFRQLRRGVSADELSSRFGRTKGSIYRIVAEVRSARLLEQPIDYMPSEEFELPEAEELICGEPPESTAEKGRLKPPPGLPPYLASLYAIPLLTREEEQYHFRKMNYYKYRAAELQAKLDRARPKSEIMDEVESLLERSLQVKNFLIRSNLRLVVSIAKRHAKPNTNFFEMVSDGNMSLIRAIEKFDYRRGNKFSTYATWAIMKNFARSIPAEHELLDRFRTGNDEVFQSSTDSKGNQFQEELANQKQHQAILEILDQLDDRERDIIWHRYGLAQNSEPQTLEEVGNRFGVTKERIRQLEARALQKLRRVAQTEKLDIPGI